VQRHWRAKQGKSKQWGYAAAVLLSIAALALTDYLGPVLAPDTATPLLVAVAVCAYVWGLGPGLLAACFTATGSALDDPATVGHGIVLVPQESAFSELTGSDFLRLALFVAVAMLIGTLRLRSQRHAAPASNATSANTEQFVVAAAHELRTPLTALYGQAQLLRRRLRRGVVDDPRIMHSVDVMVRQADRLNKTVNTFIDVASIDQGLLTLRPTQLDLDALVRRAVAAGAPRYPTSRLTVAGAATPLFVLGDEVRLMQTMEALLDNAARFSPHGGDVTVAVYRDEQQAYVTVSDRGIGVPREALPHIFDSFYRAPNAEALSLCGAGVGLYLARAIVDQHGGTLTAENRPGGGSVFRIALPLLEQ
jgi:signal transduction histidine kinase